MTRKSQQQKPVEESESLRVDKWLWTSRFFKTRSLATEAVTGGHVQLNGARIKPSRAVKPGDQLRIKKAGYEHIVDVLGVSEKRGSATLAQQLYAETEASQQQREADAASRRAERLSSPDSGTKPDKKSRRDRLRFLGKH